MPTARDIIQDALEKLQVYAPGEQAAQPDLARGLSVLNDMLDSWSNESLMCFANTETSVTLITSQPRYSFTGAARPLKINDAAGSAYVQDSQGNNYPCDIVDQPAWNLIGNRTVTGNVPDTVFYDPQYPTAYLNVFPTPQTAGYTLFFDAQVQLTAFALLSTSFSFPPGYRVAMTHNLAIDLASYFPTAVMSPALAQRAAETKGAIKRKNAVPPIANFDPEIISRGSPTYNIFRDR